MKATLFSLLLFAGFMRLVSGSDSAFTDALLSAPKCAVTCAVQALPQSPCAIDNTTCLCTNPTFNGLVGDCVKSACTITEALSVQNLTWSACGFPLTDSTSSARYTIIFLLILPVGFMAARMTARVLRLSPWGAEDTAIVLAFLFFIPLVPVSFFLIDSYGLGKDIWTLQPHQLTMFFKLIFVLQFFYVLDLAVIKASILYLYLRVFNIGSFRTVLWCTQGFNFLVGATYIILSLAQCQPLDYYWNGWDGEHEGKCVDLDKFGLTHVAFHIALDVWMLILPALQVSKLNLPRKRKIGVMAMFGVGVCLTIVSIIRIKSLVLTATAYNITGGAILGTTLCYVELCVGIVVACMPAARQVALKFFPKLVYLTRQTPSTSSKTDRWTNNTEELRPISGGRPSLKSEATGATTLRSNTSILDPNTPKSATFTINGSRHEPH